MENWKRKCTLSLNFSLYILFIFLLCLLCVRSCYRQLREYCSQIVFNRNRISIFYPTCFRFHCATLSPKGWRWQSAGSTRWASMRSRNCTKNTNTETTIGAAFYFSHPVLPLAAGVKLTREWDCIRCRRRRRRRCPSSIHFHLSKCTS